MQSICEAFPITNEEFSKLEKEYGNLAKFISWELIKKNTRNNHTDDFDDINQELLLSIIRAGSYYKRQIYIENCLKTANSYAKDGFVKFILEELENLWDNRKRHGASRQKFGNFQEKVLEKIIKRIVPKNDRPNKKKPLEIDSLFSNYCKSITWNTQKSMGKKITKEKSIRASQVSLTEFEFLS